ncbi:DUF1187 family protein [Escherichia coli]|nr:DUF1187 family protein [Morganella morganii]MEC6303417.1 DUF1187 family protein [Escherichia coli]
MKPGNPPVFWTRYSGNKMTRFPGLVARFFYTSAE